MKTTAAILYQMEQPGPYAQTRPLAIEEVTLPPPGPGEVLVEMGGAGLCHSDLSVMDGSRPRPVPIILGHEASGIVREMGAGVADFSPGDHVVFSFIPPCGACAYCKAGRPALCIHGNRANLAGTLLSGARRFTNAHGHCLHHHCGISAFARHTLAMAESLVKIDASVPLEVAALFGCAVVTGVGAVLNTAQVAAGESVAVFGLGGVGLSAVMGANASGASPIIAVDLFEHKLALARELGATHTVDASRCDPVQMVRELSDGGVMHAFESAGNEQAMIQAFHATRPGGNTVTIGLPHPAKQFSVPGVILSAEERVVRGSYMGSCVPRRDIPRFIELYRRGRLPVEKLLSRTLRLEEINEGFDALARGEAVRQVIRFH
jgi:alcohol dehydrogenase